MKHLYTEAFPPCRICLFILILSLSSLQAYSASYSGGSGSVSDPYQISSLEDLYTLSQTSADWDKYFMQTADINASATSSWDDGKGFSPIGNDSKQFSGTYNGDGHCIDSLFINRNQDHVGLFGWTRLTKIENLSLTNCDITGGTNNVAALVAVNYGKDGAEISNCYISGSIKGNGVEVGALVGDANGELLVRNCHADVSIFNTGNNTGGLIGRFFADNAAYYTGDEQYIFNCSVKGQVVSSGNNCGGLIGESQANVEYCSSTASVRDSVTSTTELHKSFGGLIGYTYDGDTILNSFASGEVYGSRTVGGLIGSNQALVSNCYATGDVLFNEMVETTSEAGWSFGGLIGSCSSGTIENCYSKNNRVEGIDEVGGLVGWLYNANVSHSYAASEVIHLSESGDVGAFIGDVHSAVESSENYADIEVSGVASAYSGSYEINVEWLNTDDFSSSISWNTAFTDAEPWIVDDDNTYPVLYWERQLDKGKGTLSDPYEIASLDDLKTLSENMYLWDKHFIQTADIDASETSMWNDGKGFSPIGAHPLGTYRQKKAFTGSYNGKGYGISQLFIDRSEYYLGLFGYISDGAVLDSVYLSQARVSGDDASYFVGALVGIVEGSSASYISNCKVDSTIVEGGSGVGALVGIFSYELEDGLITNCHTLADVSGLEKVGGLVGRNHAQIIDCSAAGSVFGENIVGGLTGINTFSVKNSHASSTVNGSGQNFGGLVGQNESLIELCYASGCVCDTTENETISEAYGGLVGNNTGTGTVLNSYATGDVYASFRMGGAIGLNSGSIKNSYASGQVIYNEKLVGIYSGYQVGGLVGKNTNEILNCYAISGAISGVNEVGGFVGYNPCCGTVKNSYATSKVSAGIEDMYKCAFIGLIEDNLPSTCFVNNYADTVLAGAAYLYNFRSPNTSYNGDIDILGFDELNLPYGESDDEPWVLDPNLAYPFFYWQKVVVGSSTIENDTFSCYVFVDDDVEITEVGILYKALYDSTWSTIQLDNVAALMSYPLELNPNLYDFKVYVKDHETTYYGQVLSEVIKYQGEGSISDPYIIAEASELWTLSKLPEDWDKVFKQTNDLDMSIADALWGDNHFSPIGNGDIAFTGTYDGQGHTISNVKIDLTENVGLFGKTDSAHISNLTLLDCHINGTKKVGALVGHSVNSTLLQCGALGQIIGYADVGGLVGNANASTIKSCYSNVIVNGKQPYDDKAENFGALLGLCNASVVEDCYAWGVVDGYKNVGGIYGYNFSTSSTSRVYAYVDVNGTENLGAFVGSQQGTPPFLSCFYNDEKVFGLNAIGYPEISQDSIQAFAYASFDQLAELEKGDGSDEDQPWLVSSHTLPYFSWQEASMSSGILSGNAFDGYSLKGSNISYVDESSELDSVFYRYRNAANEEWIYCSLDEADLTASISAFNLGHQYYLQFGAFDKNGTLFYSDFQTCKLNGMRGEGSVEFPYCLFKLDHLLILQNDSSIWDKHFLQISDIDARCSQEWTEDQSFSPIGDVYYSNDTVRYTHSDTIYTPFSGVYDGNYYAIKGLKINKPDQDLVGLFGYAKGAELKHITISDVQVEGRVSTGALLGMADDSTKITHSSSSGTVLGASWRTGGLVGQNAGHSIIKQSFSTAFVSGVNNAGGLVGENIASTIKDCYATGIVDCKTSGGLVGVNDSVGAIIQNSYATGFQIYSDSVQAGGDDPSVGGLVGVNHNGSIDACYFDNVTTGLSSIGAGGSMLSTDEFRDSGKFSKWTFAGTDSLPWLINPNGRPYLYWQKMAVSNSSVDVFDNNKMSISSMPLGSSEIIETGIVYKGENDDAWANTKMDSISGISSYEIQGLSPSKNYYSQAYVMDADSNYYYGDMVHFTSDVVVIINIEGKGSVTNNLDNTIAKHEQKDVDYTFNADEGYHIKSVVLDNVPQTEPYDITFSKLDDNHTIDVVFEIDTFTVSVAADGNGSVTPSGNQIVDYGSALDITLTPDKNFHVDSISGISQDLVDSLIYGGVLRVDSIKENKNIQVFFVENTYTITSLSDANGQISPEGDSTLMHNDSISYTLVPKDTSFQLFNLMLGDSSVIKSVNGGFYIHEVMKDDTLRASFINDSISRYMLKVSAGRGGTISPCGFINVEQGADKAFNIIPDEGFYISDIFFNNQKLDTLPLDSTKGGKYELANVQSADTLDVAFDIFRYEISASAGENGSICPSGDSVLEYGSSMKVTAVPDKGYHVSELMVDSLVIKDASSYEFNYITANHSINAVFEINEYTVSTSSGKHGQLSFVGDSIVQYGDSFQLLIEPDEGYFIRRIYCNGIIDSSDIDSAFTYSLDNIDADKTISVEFEISGYSVLSASSLHGSVSPLGLQRIIPGGSQQYTFTPDKGYHISQVLLDSVIVDEKDYSNGVYILSDVKSSHSLDVVFEIDTFQVSTALLDDKGIILPATLDSTVDYGTTLEYSIYPNDRYHIKSLTVNGSSIIDSVDIYGGSFTLKDIDEDQYIQASFEINMFEVVVISEGYGSISPASGFVAIDGSNTTFTITPDAGYQIQDLWLDSVSVLSSLYMEDEVYKYTISNIKSEHQINVIFEPDNYTIESLCGENGTLSHIGDTLVEPRSDVEYLITPDLNYRVASVFYNGESLMSDLRGDSVLVLKNVNSNGILGVYFEPDVFTVSVSSDANGSTFPLGDSIVYRGANVAVSIIPHTNYCVKDILVNDVSALSLYDSLTQVLNLVGIEQDMQVEVEFEKIIHTYYKLNVIANNGGYVSFVGDSAIVKGSEVAIAIEANLGYEIDDVELNGTSVYSELENGQLTLKDISEDMALVVHFAELSYTVTVTASGLGEVLPSGQAEATQGSLLDYLILPHSSGVLDSIILTSVVGEELFTDFSEDWVTHVLRSADGETLLTETLAPDYFNEVIEDIGDGEYRLYVNDIAQDITIRIVFNNKTSLRLAKDNSLSIYPNPAGEYLIVEGLPINAEVLIRKIDGTIVLSSKTENIGYQKIDISHLDKGIYLLRVGHYTEVLVVE